MDTIFIRMLRTEGDYAEGEIYEIDVETAQALIDAGAAEEVDNPQPEAEAKLNKTINAVVANVRKELKVHGRVPAIARKEDKSFGEFLKAVAMADDRDSRNREKGFNLLKNKYTKAMNETTGGDGGYLVPEEYVNELLKVDGFETVLYPGRATIRQTSLDKVYIPILDQTVTPSGGTSAFRSNVATAKVSEGSAPSGTSQPKIKQLEFEPVKRMSLCEVTFELLKDSPLNVEKSVTELFREQSLFEIDYDAFNGDGTNGIEGIIDNAATYKQSRKTAGRVQFVDLALMYSRLTPRARKSAVWVVNPLIIAEMLTMESTAGQLVWVPNAVGGVDMRLFGLPVLDSEAMPSLGNPGDVCLMNPSDYYFMVNTEFTVDSSDHYKYNEDKRVYRFKYRVAGKPKLSAPILLADGVSEVSPFVQLDDVAS